jgi:peroxiredoxin
MKYILLLITLTLLITACSTTQTAEQAPESFPDQKLADNPEKSTVDWRTITVTDVNTNTQYKVNDFKGKPIIIESFAVWCPKCTAQQKEVKELHELNKEVISISLDTDPNEDESFVKEHAQKNGFDWRYSVAPREMTISLIDEFGTGVVNAPSTPVILICPDGTTNYLSRGSKKAEDLQEAIKAC